MSEELLFHTKATTEATTKDNATDDKRGQCGAETTTVNDGTAPEPHDDDNGSESSYTC